MRRIPGQIELKQSELPVKLKVVGDDREVKCYEIMPARSPKVGAFLNATNSDSSKSDRRKR